MPARPLDAITLVLGTETRGIDIPTVAANFETNVPGIFVAGELGGMGLIRNAIEQGRQAIESVRGVDGIGSGDGLDVLIVGAGPAGFSASLSAMQHGLRCATIEQETLGGTVAHYPRGKIVMTSPVQLPLVGKVKLRETTKEALLEFWQDVEAPYGSRDSLRRASRGRHSRGRRLRGGDLPRQASDPNHRVGDRPARHPQKARGARRGLREGRLPAHRPRAVPRPQGPRRRRRRQRAWRRPRASQTSRIRRW